MGTSAATGTSRPTSTSTSPPGVTDATGPAPAPRSTGTAVGRLDLPDKVTGRPRYVHDLRLPGQWFARVVRQPSPAATLRAVDDRVTSALTHEGLTVVRDGSFLALAGPDEARVVLAVERLRSAARWDELTCCRTRTTSTRSSERARTRRSRS